MSLPHNIQTSIKRFSTKKLNIQRQSYNKSSEPRSYNMNLYTNLQSQQTNSVMDSYSPRNSVPNIRKPSTQFQYHTDMSPHLPHELSPRLSKGRRNFTQLKSFVADNTSLKNQMKSQVLPTGSLAKKMHLDENLVAFNSLGKRNKFREHQEYYKNSKSQSQHPNAYVDKRMKEHGKSSV